MRATCGSYAALSSVGASTEHPMIEHLYRLAVFHEGALAADLGLLSERERAWLAEQELQAPQRDEWIRGRIALGRVQPVGWIAALAHHGGWFAVASRPRTCAGAHIAVEVVLERDRTRAWRGLARLHVRLGAEVEAVAAWAALECARALRGVNVFSFGGRAAGLRVEAAPGGLEVTGLGAPVRCRLHRPAPILVAVAAEDGAAS